MKYLQSKNQFLLVRDWKKLLIASHYLNNRTQKLDSRNYAYFANSVLGSKLTSKLTVSGVRKIFERGGQEIL